MKDISRILAPCPAWDQKDAASDLLLHVAIHIRRRHTDSIRLVINHEYLSDMAAANNLLVLSREVLYNL